MELNNNKKVIDMDMIKNTNKNIDNKLIKASEKLAQQSRKFGHNTDSEYALNVPFSRKLFSSLGGNGGEKY